MVFNSEALQEALAARRVEKKYTILVVDDEPANIENLAYCLSDRYNVLTAGDGREALALVRDRVREELNPIHVIIADQRMPHLSGVDFLEKTLDLLPRAKRIVLTAYTDFPVVVKAINQAQVYRFILKPWNPDQILEMLAQALETYEAEEFEPVTSSEILGNHPKLRKCLEIVAQVADAAAPVLVRGETGTGKELIARALHRQSGRGNRPLVTIHCGALPESLMEAELFGHTKGAFTGATEERPGRLSRAHNSTLFIDEIGELPLPTQAKLLRFLQFGEIQRLGSDRTERLDVRVVAATHRDLTDMVQQGTFREDLYFRLKVVDIVLPPLRERGDDLALLIEKFLAAFWRREEQPLMLEETMMILRTYPFPGNIRELKHVVERACLLTKSREITPNLLPAEILEHCGRGQPAIGEEVSFETLTNDVLKASRQEACKRASDEVERRFLEQLLATHKTVVAAARWSGINRSYLHRLLTKHDFREP